MNKITRYNLNAVQTEFGFTHAVMVPETNGICVTYESHQAEVERLRGRVDALKSMQKQDFFYHLQKGLGKVAEQAIENAINEIAHLATQTSFKVNPPDNLTAEMVREMCDKLKGGFATGGIVTAIAGEPLTVGGLVSPSQLIIGDHEAYIKDFLITDGVIKNAVSDNPATASYNVTMGVKIEDAKEVACRQPLPMPLSEVPGLKCIKSSVDYFTSGKSYPFGYEICGGVKTYFISADNFFADLNDGDQWEIEDGGAYFIVRNQTEIGEIIAAFKKPE